MPKIRDEYDVGAAFAAIENELMSSMVRNMERHKVEEIDEEKEWEMWQALQLKSLDKYKRQNKEKYGTQFQDINKRIGNILIRMNEDGQMDQERKILKAIKNGADLTKASDAMSGRFFEINDRKMDALIKATTGEIRKAETAVLRKADDVYRKTIFNAQVYANSGAGTYEKAVDMATKDFIAAGLNCVEYKNGARHTLSDYADMAVRTAAKRAYLQGEGTKRQEWGIHTVIVNQRSDTGPGGVCPECLPFVGKVFIDDVWSGGKEGEKDEDGEELPLLSDAIGAGLYHPRCRDSHTTYFPGISTPPSGKITKKDVQEAVETEKEEARQQYAERQAEKYERLADTRLDPENQQKYEARSEGWRSKSDELTERRKRRLAERNKASEPKTSGIQFDDHVSEQQRQLLENLSSQYNTRLQRVEIGAEKAAGDVDVSGSRMRLSDKHENTAIHEFAHTLAHTNADKFGLTQDQDFWKEIRKIRREYMKDVEGDPSRWISTYEHSSRSLDEFMAEAFTHAKMREHGLPIPDKYGKDFTYSQRVLDTVDKYFGKKDVVTPMASTDTINWPKSGIKIGKDQFKAIRAYANERGIQLAGVKKSDLDLELVRDVIDKTSEMIKQYDIQSRIDYPFTLDFSNPLRPQDFAESYPGTKHIIYFNRDAFRNKDTLEKEYKNLESDGFFVKGTTYKSIPYHEIGHIIADIYDINSIEIAKQITGLNTEKQVLDYVSKNLSTYAGKPGGDEIISECFSAVYSGVQNDFALQFFEVCSSIILRR